MSNWNFSSCFIAPTCLLLLLVVCYALLTSTTLFQRLHSPVSPPLEEELPGGTAYHYIPEPCSPSFPTPPIEWWRLLLVGVNGGAEKRGGTKIDELLPCDFYPAPLLPPHQILDPPNLEDFASTVLTNPLRRGLHLERIIGQGGYGLVISATLDYPTPTRFQPIRVAIKRVKRSKKEGNASSNSTSSTSTLFDPTEMKALKTVRHYPFTSQLLATFTLANHNYMVLDYTSGGDMHVNLAVTNRSGVKSPGLSEPVARFIAAQLVLFLERLHKRDERSGEMLIHTDLKAANVMLKTNGYIRVIDFGLALFIPPGRTNTILPENRAADPRNIAIYPPELIALIQTKEKDHQMSNENATIAGVGYFYGPEIDVWQLGVLIHELLTSAKPFFYYASAPRAGKFPGRMMRLRRHSPDDYLKISEDYYASIRNGFNVCPTFYEQPRGKLEQEWIRTHSAESLDLLRQLMHESPAKRLENFSKIRSHPWFKRVTSSAMWELLERQQIQPSSWDTATQQRISQWGSDCEGRGYVSGSGVCVPVFEALYPTERNARGKVDEELLEKEPEILANFFN